MVKQKQIFRKLIPAFATAIWLVIFLIFIAPFDASDLSFLVRVQIMVVYGVIFFLCYLLILAFEQWLESRALPFWLHELVIHLCVYLVVFPPTLLYYESDIVNGDYGRMRFFLEQYLPILIVITPVLFAFRKLVSTSKRKTTITIRGTNKRDVLQIERSQLVCVVSSDNYIQVCFIDKGQLQKKLLRSTLGKTEKEMVILKRTHRSYLINPDLFTEWVTRDKILVGGMEIPVTKQYRGNIPS